MLAVAEHAAPAFAELIEGKDDLWAWTYPHQALIDGLLNNEAFVQDLIPLVSSMLDNGEFARLNRAFWWMGWIARTPCGEAVLKRERTLIHNLVNRLGRLHDHPKKGIRRSVVALLCDLPSRKAIALGVDMLDDPAESVRRKAARRLGRAADRYPEALTDTDQADRALQIALEDRSLKVQRRAKALLEAQKTGER